MFEISGLRRMLEECGVPTNKSQKLANVLEQSMLHGIVGTEFPPFTGMSYHDISLGTNIAKAISERIAKKGKIKRESELRVGDIVVRVEQTSPWGQMLVLKHTGRNIKFSRPYGSMSGAGTTCPTMYVGIENFETSYTEKVEWQQQYLVVGRDTVSMMEDVHATIRCIDRNRLNKYINVLRNALELDYWTNGEIAKIEWVLLQNEAMGLANHLIEKELDVPYPE